ncbi:serine/threonine-protein kinase [Streptosporangium saharense]|uniref:non-specific serine/threonine protein kinase n=1 Tax=Streptosporangium saharense TaxID=1706840 RepID=A0A7W7VK08_9ACTN|nr:serine/threonine-protein kinase [Streptosporangium saharense]MBB4913078.1 serine/threonine-protein kinase [Streptosporangium saharense]
MRVGTMIGSRFRLDKELGSGSWGQTFKARDLITGADVAVKIQHRRSFDTTQSFESSRADFEAEGKNLVQLRGVRGVPEWVCEGDIGEIPGEKRRYIAMELCAGGSLEGYIEVGKATLTCVAASVAGQLSEILAEIHRKGLVHRDVKPENILIEPDGEVRLLDVGLACRVGELPPSASGTEGYSGPEQFRKDEPTRFANDVFALGCVLFDMLVQVLPYDGNARTAKPGDPQFPPGTLDGVHPVLKELGLAMISPNAADRPTADAVLRALGPVLPAPGSLRPAKVRPPDVTRWYRKGPGVTADTH